MGNGVTIIPEADYRPLDFWHEDDAKCPWCKTDVSTDESYDAELEENECSECGNKFTLTAEHSVTWTTRRVGNE